MSLRKRGYLAEGKYADGGDFLRALRKVITKHMPPGDIRKLVIKNGLAEKVISLVTTLEKNLDKVPNKLWDNDRALQKFFIYGVKGDESLKGKMEAKLLMGGELGVTPESGSGLDSASFGWRNKTGTPEQILKHFDAYFAKVAKVIKANKKRIAK